MFEAADYAKKGLRRFLQTKPRMEGVEKIRFQTIWYSRCPGPINKKFSIRRAAKPPLNAALNGTIIAHIRINPSIMEPVRKKWVKLHISTYKWTTSLNPVRNGETAGPRPVNTISAQRRLTCKHTAQQIGFAKVPHCRTWGRIEL
jgi:hypothetical protein